MPSLEGGFFRRIRGFGPGPECDEHAPPSQRSPRATKQPAPTLETRAGPGPVSATIRPETERGPRLPARWATPSVCSAGPVPSCGTQDNHAYLPPPRNFPLDIFGRTRTQLDPQLRGPTIWVGQEPLTTPHPPPPRGGGKIFPGGMCSKCPHRRRGLDRSRRRHSTRTGRPRRLHREGWARIRRWWLQTREEKKSAAWG